MEQKTDAVQEKVADEGNVLDRAIPLNIFPDNYAVPDGIDATAALLMGMREKWEDDYQDVITTVEDHALAKKGLPLIKKKNLTIDECCAIIYYTCEVTMIYPAEKSQDNPYKVINTIMSNREPEKLLKFQAFLYFLISGLKKLDNFSGIVYRGLGSALPKLSSKYQKDSIFCWVGFTSTSSERGVMDRFLSKSKTAGTKMKIYITEGKDLQQLSLLPTEKEYLLLPNSYFKVVEVLPHDSSNVTNQINEELGNLPNIDRLILQQIEPPILKPIKNIPKAEQPQEKQQLNESETCTEIIDQKQKRVNVEIRDNQSKPSSALFADYLLEQLPKQFFLE